MARSLCAVIALASFACSDPSYGQTDGTSDGAASQPDGAASRSDAALARSDGAASKPDGATQADASVDVSESGAQVAVESATFELGQYAVVARFYGTSADAVGGSYGEESVVLAEVTRVDDGLRMTWKMCAYRGGVFAPILLGPISYAAVKPEMIPDRTLQLTVNGKNFSAVGDPSLIGYQETSDCGAHPERPWLSNGQCTCPNSSTLLPTSPTDCRVIDSDGDNLPGFTVQFTGGSENFSYNRARDGSQIVNGVIDPHGSHTADLVSNIATYQLDCQHGPCARGAATVCPPASNPVRFQWLAPRATPWTCSDVMNVVDGSGDLGLGQITMHGC